MVDKLTLQCPEEAFHTGVVPTIPLTAHAGAEPVRIEETLVTCSCRLAYRDAVSPLYPHVFLDHLSPRTRYLLSHRKSHEPRVPNQTS